MTFFNGEHRDQAAREGEICPEPPLKSDIEDPLFMPVMGRNAAPASNLIIFDLSTTAKLRHTMRKRTKKAKRIAEEEVPISIQKDAKEALSGIFHVEFDETNERSKNLSFNFMGGVLTQMAAEGFLDDLHDRNIERWTESFSFIIAFTRCALNSPNSGGQLQSLSVKT